MYSPYFKEYFRKVLEKQTKKNPILKKRVQEEVEELKNSPYHNSKELKGRFKGKRSVYIGKSGHRLIYSICEECRKKQYEKFNSCLDCEEKSNDSIIFWDLQPRKVAYE